MKLRTFILTIIAHSMNHATRMCWAFNKPSIRQVFEVDQFYLGLADGFFFIMNGIACIFPYSIIKSNNLTLIYLLTIIPFILSFANLGYASYLFQMFAISPIVKKLILLISMGSYGFFNFTMWPIPLALVSMYYNSETEGGWLGFWSANWEIGNIIGLFISNFLVHQLVMRWQSSVFVISILNIIFALAIYLFLDNPKNYLQKKIQTSSDYWNFLKSCLQSKQMISFLIISALISAIFNCFLFWMPFYITSIGYGSVSGYFTIILDFAAIIGAYFVGKSYQKSQKNNQNENWISKSKKWIIQNLFYIVMIVSIIITCAWIFVKTSIIGYAILTIILGFLFGGMFNSVHSNEVFLYTQNKLEKVIMFTYLISVISSITTGLFEIILGFSMNGNKGTNNYQSINYKNMFYVIFVIQILALVMFFVRDHMRKTQNVQNANSKQQKAMYEAAIPYQEY